MAADPEMQRGLKSSQTEFAVTETDGLERR